MSRAKRRSRSEWEKIVREYLEGSESVGAFARRKEVNEGTFRTWLGRLGVSARGRTSSERPVEFLSVTTSGPAAPRPAGQGEAIEVAYAGITLRFPVGTAPEYLGAVFLELRAAC